MLISDGEKTDRSGNGTAEKWKLIDDLCVDEKIRGKHIGRQLYNYVPDYARGSGCYNVTLNVWEGNDRAKSFYEAMGMKAQKTGMEQIL